MASEIRANKSTNRAGLGTVTYADTGIIVSGIVTCTELSGLTALNISGVGTANTLDINGDIDVDGHTNLDNVSISGVTTITGALHADGFSTVGGEIAINGTVPRIGFTDSNANSDFRIKVDGGSFQIEDITNSSSDRLTINSSGNVSINKDLDVDGHTNLDNLSIAGIATFSGILDATNTPASIRVAQDIQHKGDADTKITFPLNDTISFDTAGSERLRIKSDGELEISPGGFLTIDTNPAATYGVAEALRIDDNAGVNDRALQIFEYSHSGARYHRIQFNTNTTTNGSAYTYTQGNYGGSSSIHFDNSGPLVFFTDAQDANGSTSSITPTERLRITTDGNIRAKTGTQYKGFTLVKADGGTVAQLVGHATDNDEGGLNLWDGGTKKVQILANGTSYLNGGTVGINDSSPNTYFKLDVNGHTNIVGDIALPTTNRIYWGNSDTAFIKGEHGGSAYLAFGANNEKMRLTRSGRLGIGTDDPKDELHIFSSNPGILITDSDQAANTKNWSITAAVSQTLRIQAQDDSNAGGGNIFDFYKVANQINEFRGLNSGNTWFVIDNLNKRVGINTDYSSNALDVWGNLNTKDSTGKNNFYITDHIIKFSQSPSNWSNMNYASNPIFGWDYKNGPGDLMYMASGGNTATANQMALVVSDVHGFKVGRSGYDGTDMDVSSSNEFFRVSTGGKVTINCTAISAGGGNPQFAVESETGSNIGILQVHAGGGESSGDLSGIAFSHGSSGTVARPKAAIALNATGSYGKGHLCFYVDGANDDNTVSSGDEKLRITTGGTLEIERGSSADQAIDIKTTATTGASRIRFVESGTSQGELAYSHNNNQLELVARSGQSIVMFTNGTNERLRISTEGYVTKPQHPGFFAYMNGGNHTTNSGNVIPFNQTHFNNGGHFKTSGTNVNKFVCPVHGIYHFTGAMWMKNGSGDSHARWQIRKNNSIICQAGWHQSNTSLFYDHSAPAAVTVECNANDTVYCYADYTITYWRGGSAHPHSYFSGYLVG